MPARKKQFPGGTVRQYQLDMRPHTQQEIRRWAWEREPHERESVPEPGERVLIREQDFGPVTPAVVVAVQDLSSPHDHWHRHGDLERTRGPGIPDPHVWQYDERRREHVLLGDPWPWVHLREIMLDGDGNEMRGEDGELLLKAPRWCREARVRGSTGWLREGSRAHTGKYGETQGE